MDRRPWPVAEAGIGEDVTFATKPQLARTMIGRVRKLGLPFAWFSADEAYGNNGKLRQQLRRNAVQNAPSSLSPTSNPRTSRCQSAATLVATTTAWDTTRWLILALH